MKRAFTLNQVIFIVILGFIGYKFIYPKFLAKTEDVTSSFASIKELSTAINDIRQYYAKYGEFSTIEIMTYVRNFENNSAKLEFNKPVRYGIKQSEGTHYCTLFEVKESDRNKEIVLTPTDDGSKICKDFIADDRYKALQKVNLDF
ncbi:hypothetical protein [Campylobacter geochelonis]|uniref:Transformation system protein CtsG n=1 Tax=Campylobacter geochelonis TaxID=1780362 RepID=A0A128ER27_9BACT|nr:hypothetical protein [Campylobacter geochelonis]QKF71750.1 hypothetical protein CGEO_1464 [Campylobacter geochelonis]CZE47589.1 transformation system protein CtsG [Campylobacter geochelonis]CZE48517.1 transformation system protein CtsG [Campylobacter geochelonis]CZE51169.1 transformation system protein CtsG [Campylobacter geochelonis]